LFPPRSAAVDLDYFTEMCSGSEAGWYLRLIDFVYHSTLGSRVIKKKKKVDLDELDKGIARAHLVQGLGFRV